MKKLLAFSFLILLLVGCANKEDLFSKKENCRKYLSAQQERIDEAEDFGGSVSGATIFYSPSLNTCVSEYIFFNGTYRSFLIYDLLTNEDIFNKGSWVEDGMSDWDEYEAKIEELKK